MAKSFKEEGGSGWDITEKLVGGPGEFSRKTADSFGTCVKLPGTNGSNLRVVFPQTVHASLNRVKSVESRALFPKLGDFSARNCHTAVKKGVLILNSPERSDIDSGLTVGAFSCTSFPT
jgi:hypothetical protein